MGKFHIKKILLIGVPIIVFLVVFVIFGSINNSHKITEIAQEYEEIVISNSWGNKSDFSDENSQAEQNIWIAHRMISDGLNEKIRIIDYSQDSLDLQLTEAFNLLKQKEFFNALGKTRSLVDGVNRAVTDFKTHHQKDLHQIDTLIEEKLTSYLKDNDFEVINYRIYDNWAIATVIIKSVKTDPGNVILKNDDESWRIIMGPITYFDREDLEKLEAPAKIIENANDMPTTNYLEKS